MADQQTEMSETMRAIENEGRLVIGRRETLKNDITKLEDDIKYAEDCAASAEAEAYSHTPVSPEQANEAKKDIVFMKKDLENKKSEYKSLDE